MATEGHMADKKDTAEYSASKAPETRKHAEEKETVKDWRLQPGGETGSPTSQGMAAVDQGLKHEGPEKKQTEG